MLYTTEKDRQEIIADDIKNKVKKLVKLNNNGLYFITIKNTKYTTTEQLRFNLQKTLKGINKKYKNSDCYIRWLSIIEYNEIVSRGNYLLDNVDFLNIHAHILIDTNIRENNIKKHFIKHFINSNILSKDAYKNDKEKIGGYLTKQKHLFTDKNYNYFI